VRFGEMPASTERNDDQFDAKVYQGPSATTSLTRHCHLDIKRAPCSYLQTHVLYLCNVLQTLKVAM